MEIDHFVPTQKDIDEYTALKTVLTEGIHKDGSVFVDKKSSTGYVGLTNHGGTCYLNSLIQSFYNLTDFRNAIFKYKGDVPAVKELQRMIANLRLSDQCAIDTADLTAALGWSSSEFFEDRDAQEVIALLIDAFVAISPELGQNISHLFKGELKDTMKCPDCGDISCTNASYLSIPLNVLDVPDSNVIEESVDKILPGLTIRTLFKRFLRPTALTADDHWTCQKCSKTVHAIKTIEYVNLPPVLNIHLKRVEMDPVTKRRVKLTHPVLFTDSLNASDIKPGSVGKYKLVNILLHQGPARGGHFKALIRDRTNKWFDFDDAKITALEDADIASLFWYNGSNSSPTDITAHDLLYETAFMLMYVLEGSERSTPTDLIPAYLETQIASENEKLVKLRDAYRVHIQMVEMQIFYLKETGVDNNSNNNNTNNKQLVLHVPRSLTLREATATAFEQAKGLGLLGTTDSVGLGHCRLRCYDPETDRVGETFGDRGDETLFHLNLHPLVTMALECRGENEVFEEFNPNTMILRILVWNGTTASNEKVSGQYIKVTVPGEKEATVGSLRDEVAKALNKPSSQIVLVRSDHSTVYELKEDNKILTQNCQMYPGDEVVVEVLNEGSTFGQPECALLTALRSGANNIRLVFNHPSAGSTIRTDTDLGNGSGSVSGPASPRSGDEYPHHLDTTLDSTLAEVKAALCIILGLDAKSFHVRRGANEPQLKDETKTMRELELVTNSVLHLQLGPGCEAGEHMLRIDLDTAPEGSFVSGPSDIVPLGEMAVAEKTSVAHLKQQLLDKWDSLVKEKNVKKPQSAAHLRIRDGKGQGGASLRDDRLMSRCLLGMADGRRLIIQVLQTPEVIANTDIILSVRVAHYGNIENGPERGLSHTLEMILPKSSTVQLLVEKIASRFPHICEDPGLRLLQEASADKEENGQDDAAAANSTTTTVAESLQPLLRQIGVAKAYSSGPALNLREIQKLKWNDPHYMGDGSLEIDKAPWTLRDGSVIVVRGQADYLKAKIQSKQKKEAEATTNGNTPSRPSSRSSVGRPRSRAAAARAKPKEKAPLLPEAGSGGLPAAPLRTTKGENEGE